MCYTQGCFFVFYQLGPIGSVTYMGAAQSGGAWPGGEALERLCSAAAIPRDDPFWHEHLLSVHAPVGGALRTPEQLSALSALSERLCTEMVRNNPRSGNLQVLLSVMVDGLHPAALPGATNAQLQQSCGCVFLVRTVLKHMIETLEPEDVEMQLMGGEVELVGGEAGAEKKPPPLPHRLVDALLHLLADAPLNDASYWLHMECLSALHVCLSQQLFAELEGLFAKVDFS